MSRGDWCFVGGVNAVWLAMVVPILWLGAAPLWAWLAMACSNLCGNLLGWAVTRLA